MDSNISINIQDMKKQPNIEPKQSLARIRVHKDLSKVNMKSGREYEQKEDKAKYYCNTTLQTQENVMSSIEMTSHQPKDTMRKSESLQNNKMRVPAATTKN